jgi:hypothetical protein
LLIMSLPSSAFNSSALPERCIIICRLTLSDCLSPRPPDHAHWMSDTAR